MRRPDPRQRAVFDGVGRNLDSD